MIETQESITAKLCAFIRAYHSSYVRNKIADDHLAYDLMGREEYDNIKEFIISHYSGADDRMFVSFINTYFAPIPLARLKFTEDRLLRFANDEKCQCVICGAGADTFSFRNDNENIEIFEVDHPDTQRFKLDRIRRLEWNVPKNVRFVPVDFNKETMIEGLKRAGFDSRKKTFFTILGVSYYLTLPVFTHTLEQIAELSSPGSVLVFDFPLADGAFPWRVYELEKMTADLGEVMTGGFSYADVSRALYSLGFQIDTYLPPEKVQTEFFENRSDGMRAFENVSLLSAEYTGGYVFE